MGLSQDINFIVRQWLGVIRRSDRPAPWLLPVGRYFGGGWEARRKTSRAMVSMLLDERTDSFSNGVIDVKNVCFQDMEMWRESVSEQSAPKS